MAILHCRQCELYTANGVHTGGSRSRTRNASILFQRDSKTAGKASKVVEACPAVHTQTSKVGNPVKLDARTISVTTCMAISFMSS